jgi:hypothetical protein
MWRIERVRETVPESLNVEGDSFIVCIHVEDGPVVNDGKGLENVGNGRFAEAVFGLIVAPAACFLFAGNNIQLCF